MTYTERQRSDAFEEEHLDWLHVQQEELVEQTRLLGLIAKHTRLQYGLTCIALGLLLLAALGVIAYGVVTPSVPFVAEMPAIGVFLGCFATLWFFVWRGEP